MRNNSNIGTVSAPDIRCILWARIAENGLLRQSGPILSDARKPSRASAIIWQAHKAVPAKTPFHLRSATSSTKNAKRQDLPGVNSMLSRASVARIFNVKLPAPRRDFAVKQWLAWRNFWIQRAWKTPPPPTFSGIGSSQLSRAASSQPMRSEEHTSELQSRPHLVCRLLL